MRRVSRVGVSLVVVGAVLQLVSAPRSFAAYANPGVLAYGDANALGNPTATRFAAPVVGMAATADGQGYWVVTADGQVVPYGDAVSYGELSQINLTAPIVGITATSDGLGYWLYGLDGGIFTFGDARYFGSTGAIKLNEPIVGMAARPDGKGYWLVAADGGIFAFGQAGFYGSTGAIKLVSPVVGMIASKDGRGYVLAAGDGGVFTFGDGPYRGSMGAKGVSAWVNSIAATPTGDGYWLANANGAVYNFGDAQFYGNDLEAPRTPPIAQIVPTPDGKGYWLLEPDAFTVTYSQPASRSAIVNLAASQIRGDPDPGSWCNPYGPCEAWCALFVTWVWGHSGVAIPSLSFVGNIYQWAVTHTSVLPPWARPRPGDAVLYGTGPANVFTAVHTGIVAQVWPDGAIDTIEGDSGPGPWGQFNVVMNGPFLPSDSPRYNGEPIFGFALP